MDIYWKWRERKKKRRKIKVIKKHGVQAKQTFCIHLAITRLSSEGDELEKNTDKHLARVYKSLRRIGLFFFTLQDGNLCHLLDDGDGWQASEDWLQLPRAFTPLRAHVQLAGGTRRPWIGEPVGRKVRTRSWPGTWGIGAVLFWGPTHSIVVTVPSPPCMKPR